jgi:large subunit ribosomal protein L10
MISQKDIPQWKLDEVNNLVELFKKYKNVIVIEVANIGDKQFQFTRKELRGKAILKMSKKSLQIRAIQRYKEESGKANLDELAENVPGQASLLFTDLDPFKIKNIFEDNMWMVPAKPNTVTSVDIWVPAGDTGLPTGQVISELNMTLRLPTRIQNETIWIRDNTRTHKAGDFVNVKQAAVLKKLGITPLESLINIHIVWADEELILADLLYMNVEKFQQELLSAYLAAQNLAIELGIIDNETIEPMIQKAYREAIGILFELPMLDEKMLNEYIRRAELNARMINSMILGGVDSESSKEEKPKAKKDKDDDKDDEAPGIGGLFG